MLPQCCAWWRVSKSTTTCKRSGRTLISTKRIWPSWSASLGNLLMRVLGIDCGTERTGYGVIDTDGRDHRLVVSGVIRTDPKQPLSNRLLCIGEGLRAVIREHCPDEAAVEGIFYAMNVKSVLTLAHARGVALLTLAEAGLDVGEYSPLEVKCSVVGFGRAEKKQVQFMVNDV